MIEVASTAPCHARVSIFLVASCRVALPYRPIQRQRIRGIPIGQNGKRRCSTWIVSLSTWPTVAGFGACAPTGGSTLVAMTTSLRTTWRNQMLEVRFDATQGCFLGQPAASDITLMIAQKAADQNRPDGRTRTPACSPHVSTGPTLYS